MQDQHWHQLVFLLKKDSLACTRYHLVEGKVSATKAAAIASHIRQA